MLSGVSDPGLAAKPNFCRNRIVMRPKDSLQLLRGLRGPGCRPAEHWCSGLRGVTQLLCLDANAMQLTIRGFRPGFVDLSPQRAPGINDQASQGSASCPSEGRCSHLRGMVASVRLR